MSRPVITDRRELAAYVAGTSVTCTAIAVALDVLNHLTFFDGWSATLRSWSVTVVVALVISLPISWLIGRAHLDLYKAKREAEILSRTDPLTGLPNRRAIFEATQRMKDSAMILVIIDIDRFKRINDTLGHLVGDAVIAMFATTLCEAVGSLCEVGRIGGEEFMLVVAPHNVEPIAEALAGLQMRLGETMQTVEGKEVAVTFSAGVAASETPGDVDGVYRQADEALYTAKSLGRNRIVFAPSFERLRQGAASRDEAMWHADAARDAGGVMTSAA